ncbi:PH domain-containing protein [uncultured Clostridium sp.]|uniref:PH domain-containing protein n=1 Tax=uncultured Clostridium sp. TaxID=59620 RepID=UPI002635BFBF|nr:PH domain-containing protein [uncultured Clostridium sp.]
MINKENRPVIILISFFVVFFISFIIFISVMVTPEKAFAITLNSNTLNISGKNATQISLNNIKEIKFLNKAPNIIFNGGGEANNMLFGHNYMKNLGFTECYVNNASGNVIYIKTTNDQFLIGLNDSVNTKNLYNKLLTSDKI